MDLELREKHEKLWFDIILRALDGSIVARSEKDIDILKKQFYGYLTKYKELLNG